MLCQSFGCKNVKDLPMRHFTDPNHSSMPDKKLEVLDVVVVVFVMVVVLVLVRMPHTIGRKASFFSTNDYSKLY